MKKQKFYVYSRVSSLNGLDEDEINLVSQMQLLLKAFERKVLSKRIKRCIALKKARFQR